MNMKLCIVAASVILTVGLCACTSDTEEPQPEEADVETVSSELSVCSGPRPICRWPEVAMCTCTTLGSLCRWRCP